MLCVLFLQAASSTSVTTHELFPLEQQIEVVEGKISMVEMDFYELRSTSQNGWQNESGDLHGQEKQLRIGEEQVCMEKLVLLHKLGK